MKRYLNLLRSVAFVCCAAPSLILAEDHETVDVDNTGSSAEGIAKEAHCGYGNGHIFDRYSGNYLPGSAHIVTKISALGDEIRFEDGSAWKVSSYDCTQAAQWLDQNIPVSVMQNTSWFSSSTFRIVNRLTGSSIGATLFQGPWKAGQKSHYVVEFDMQQGTVKLSSLEEVTRWKIHPADMQRFQDWNFNDTIPVIIGQNADYDAYWSPDWEGLLINVRKTKSFVRAHQY